MKLSAVVHPSLVPKWQRWGWYGAVALTFFFGCLMLDTFPIAPTLIVLAVVLWLLAPLALWRSPYRAEIQMEPGALRVRPRFGLPYRIETSSLEGASIAAVDDVPVVTLAQRNRVQTTFELERGASTGEIRRVLGIPTGGFGDLQWRYAPSPLELVTLLGRTLGAVVLVVLAAVPGHVPQAFVGPVIVFLGSVGILAIIVNLTQGHLLAMNGSGVSWRDNKVSFTLGYAEVERVDDDGRSIAIHSTDGRAFFVPCAAVRLVPSGLRKGERRAMVRQLQDAVSRSKGRARVDEAAAYANELARGFASTASWIARLDALAISHANAPGGYRGSTIPLEALWRILEDHDVAPTSRAAAARMLSRITGEKAAARIDEAVASTHDEGARALIQAIRGNDAQQTLGEIENQARLAGELTR